ncbi:predicted protein [Thalassiosira pseudonana CCMP1335]|uniref:Uncharacterized protein n=1 Tax=Thalassiosira pseudonana TaxID=35128 RepID=B8BTC5_THAPS|nr:predicted protein [Thalassiosira pseudonana CCMP1335]EED95071.1 predicted protein [Thalassiosira pseudonana CCMP1335]
MTTITHNHDAHSTTNSNDISATLPFIILFFLSMILHELALESISTIYSLPPYSCPNLASTITLFQFGFCVLLPLAVSLCSKKGDVVKNLPRNGREVWVYVKLSAVVYGATALATMSLGYEGITYVTKVVFKSSKLIPTMLVGVLLDARRARNSGKGRDQQQPRSSRIYGVWEYASAALLCLGAAGFCMSPDDGSGSRANEGDGGDHNAIQDAGDENDASMSGQMSGHWIGIALLTASVFCDALVPNIQEQLMHGTAESSQTQQSTQLKEHDDIEVEMKSLLDQDGGGNVNSKTTATTTSHHTQRNGNKQGISSSSLMVNTNAIGFIHRNTPTLPPTTPNCRNGTGKCSTCIH